MGSEEQDLPNLPAEHLDAATFEQILEMDDDAEDREFSRGIVFGFFEQAENTFAQMEESIKNKNLQSLSDLGHFLKGSSATLGLNNMKQSCEKIQNWGQGKDENGNTLQRKDQCLDDIKTELSKLTREFRYVETSLRAFYSPSR